MFPQRAMRLYRPVESLVDMEVGYFVDVGDEKLVGVKVVVDGDAAMLLPW